MEVGGSAPPGCTWAQSAHLVDGAGWRGRWTWPTSQGVRFSSFTLGLTDPQRNAAGRDGDLTGLIRPKISGQYGALRLGPGRSPRMVLSTIRVGVSTRGPNHLAPVAQTEEAAGPNPACARSNRVGGTSPVMLGWLSARFVRGSARVRHSPPALCRPDSPDDIRNGATMETPARGAGAHCDRPLPTPARTRRSVRRPDLAHYLVVTVSIRDGKQTRCRTRSTRT